jgi:hypothetical protein
LPLDEGRDDVEEDGSLDWKIRIGIVDCETMTDSSASIVAGYDDWNVRWKERTEEVEDSLGLIGFVMGDRKWR